MSVSLIHPTRKPWNDIHFECNFFFLSFLDDETSFKNPAVIYARPFELHRQQAYRKSNLNDGWMRSTLIDHYSLRYHPSPHRLYDLFPQRWLGYFIILTYMHPILSFEWLQLIFTWRVACIVDSILQSTILLLPNGRPNHCGKADSTGHFKKPWPMGVKGLGEFYRGVNNERSSCPGYRVKQRLWFK
jgi:hypothetical protein